jgi:superfamily II DNA/RNA helicase
MVARLLGTCVFTELSPSSVELDSSSDHSSEVTSSSDVSAAPVVAAQAPDLFAAYGLAPELLKAVADLGFTTPTAVQERTIAPAIEGGDWMVSSQTGSGKTAAFLLPVLHTLLGQMKAQQEIQRAAYKVLADEAAARGEEAPKKPKRKNPIDPRNFRAATPGALILCPTRELAEQVANDAIDLVKHCTGLRIATVMGGMPFGMQISKLQNANLVVATPGRLLDLQRRLQIKLDQVQFLVVDEADRMLDLGFADDLAEINQLTIKRTQTMMFSATFAPRIMSLASRVMRAPKRIEVHSAGASHANIKQLLHWADSTAHKRKLLNHWLRDTSVEQALVFASTQIECDALANELADDGFSAVALHGALNQALRNRRLGMFREGRVQFLVATDVAARGLDVPTISHVINFGLPMKAEDYVHRIGRTGRAGRNGNAITLAEFRDRRKIGDIEHYTQQQLKATVIPGLEPTQKPRPEPRGKFGGGGFAERSFAPPHPGKSNRNSGFSGRDQNAFTNRSDRKPFEGARDNRGAPAHNGGFKAPGNNFSARPQRSDDFRSAAPRGDFRPAQPQGDFRPATPRGDFRPASPRGDFNAAAPRVDRAERGDFRPAAPRPGFGAKPASGKFAAKRRV